MQTAVQLAFVTSRVKFQCSYILSRCQCLIYKMIRRRIVSLFAEGKLLRLTGCSFLSCEDIDPSFLGFPEIVIHSASLNDARI